MNLASMRGSYFLIEISASDFIAKGTETLLKDRGRRGCAANSGRRIQCANSNQRDCIWKLYFKGRLGKDPVFNISFIYTRRMVHAICSQLNADGQNA